MQSTGANEYRVTILDQAGNITRRQIVAGSVDQAKKRAAAFISRNSTIQSIEKKITYQYRVRQGNKIIEGTQSAYTKDEVVIALKRLGFEIKSVRRQRKLFSSAPASEIVGFVTQSAKLIEQKLPFQDVLQLMANHTKEKNLRGALREIINDLRNGSDSREAFLRQAPVFGYHTSLMLGIATKSGDMKKVFESVALLVERQADFRKGLTSSLMLPGITALTLVGAIGFYVVFLLPQMMEMLGPRMDKIPPLTAFTLEASAWFKENFIILIGSVVLFCAFFYIYINSPAGRLRFHQYLIRVPYFGSILRDTSIEIFCRVFGIMYTSSGENIDAIQIAGDASGNPYLAYQIRTVAIPLMLRFGVELGKAIEETGFFPEMVLSRFKTGAETGNVKATAIQVADYYQMENGYAMKNLANVIEMSVTIMITLSLVFLTYLSSETANVRIK
jgi:type IV pilus assembly protein PilC